MGKSQQWQCSMYRNTTGGFCKSIFKPSPNVQQQQLGKGTFDSITENHLWNGVFCLETVIVGRVGLVRLKPVVHGVQSALCMLTPHRTSEKNAHVVKWVPWDMPSGPARSIASGRTSRSRGSSHRNWTPPWCRRRLALRQRERRSRQTGFSPPPPKPSTLRNESPKAGILDSQPHRC